jgi:hypothetical protein
MISSTIPHSAASQEAAISSGDDLERRIGHQAALLREDRSPDENRATWLELTRLHAMRSQERVEQMERERKLR